MNPDPITVTVKNGQTIPHQCKKQDCILCKAMWVTFRCAICMRAHKRPHPRKTKLFVQNVKGGWKKWSTEIFLGHMTVNSGCLTGKRTRLAMVMRKFITVMLWCWNLRSWIKVKRHRSHQVPGLETEKRKRYADFYEWQEALDYYLASCYYVGMPQQMTVFGM